MVLCFRNPIFGLLCSQILLELVAVEGISGADIYETAVRISQETWETADTVVLAKGTDFPDALAGGPLVFKEIAPILLTKSEELTAVTKDEIIRLGARNVIYSTLYSGTRDLTQE